MTYFEKLRSAARARDSLLCVGLDPDPDRIPGGAGAAARFCLSVVEQTSDFACCYKPNSAFWEQYGPDGMQALLEVRGRIPADIPVLLDAKRGDIDSSMRAYARAMFEVLGADAVTAHGYLGRDSLEPLIGYSDRATYILCRTSNPGAGDLQDQSMGGSALYLRMAEMAKALAARHGNVGLVVGATYPEQVAELRARAPDLPFLLPGVGAQGGDLAASVRAAWNGDPASCLVSVSRGVIYASEPGRSARELRDQIRQHVGAPA